MRCNRWLKLLWQSIVSRENTVGYQVHRYVGHLFAAVPVPFPFDLDSPSSSLLLSHHRPHSRGNKSQSHSHTCLP